MKKGYNIYRLLNYVKNEVELTNGKSANKETIPYSDLHTTSYVYDETSKTYTRYARGIKQTDFDMDYLENCQ